MRNRTAVGVLARVVVTSSPAIVVEEGARLGGGGPTPAAPSAGWATWAAWTRARGASRPTGELNA